MAYWGQALVLGPNINALMEPNEEPQRLRAGAEGAVAEGARQRRASGPTSRRWPQRYSGKAEDRSRATRRTPTAMREVHEQFPDDLDAATLYVESMMDLRPWGYWQRDGAAARGHRRHRRAHRAGHGAQSEAPGALHMYIHLMEAHEHAGASASSAADTLLTLMPAAGHMVHMPAHIYQRVGRYADAIKSNQLAIAADEDYITQCRAQGLYPMAYYPHNIHFLWFAATFDGQSRLAIESARKLAPKIDDETLKALPLAGGFRMVPYYALTRFGRWDEMLEGAGAAGRSALCCAARGTTRAAWRSSRRGRLRRRRDGAGTR